MTNVERISIIDKSKLSGALYFPSLLDAAQSRGLLGEEDLKQIKLGCFSLLAQTTDRYTKGNSSSIPMEVAQNLMQSDFFTVGVQLKSYQTPDDAVAALKKIPLTELYSNGRKLISIKLRATHQYYRCVLSSMLDTDNDAYNETLTKGITSFFKQYDQAYLAHEILISVDYPLFNEVTDLAGIEFIQKYLESAKCENDFCQHFLSEAVHTLLQQYHKDYASLLFNIFEQVLLASLSCVLTKSPILALHIPTISALDAIFSGKSEQEVATIIATASDVLCEQLMITDSQQHDYIKAALPRISASIFMALSINSLQTVFVSPKQVKEVPQISFSYGEKMDDELYRDVISAIMECDLISSKLDIIKREIHSLADLEDLLLDAELEPNELAAVFSSLEPTELAALAAHHPNKEEAYDLSEYEVTLRLCLHGYIRSLSPQTKSQIEAAAEHFR